MVWNLELPSNILKPPISTLIEATIPNSRSRQCKGGVGLERLSLVVETSSFDDSLSLETLTCLIDVLNGNQEPRHYV